MNDWSFKKNSQTHSSSLFGLYSVPTLPQIFVAVLVVTVRFPQQQSCWDSMFENESKPLKQLCVRGVPLSYEYEKYYPNTLSHSQCGGFQIHGLYYPNILNLLLQDLIVIFKFDWISTIDSYKVRLLTSNCTSIVHGDD